MAKRTHAFLLSLVAMLSHASVATYAEMDSGAAGNAVFEIA